MYEKGRLPRQREGSGTVGVEGFRAVLFAWAFAAVLFGTVALLVCGLVYWNSWLFLAGLFGIQLYVALCRYCDRLMSVP